MRRIAVNLTLVASAAGLIMWTSGEVPHWRYDGTRMIIGDKLQPVGSFPFRLPAASIVHVIGDSNVRGNRNGPPERAFPAILQDISGQRLQVENLGVGGATAASLSNSAPEEAAPALVLIMIGSNDAATRGLLSSRTPTPVGHYEASMRLIVECYQRMGTQVLILAPPPVGSGAMTRRIAPYTSASQKVARYTGAGFLDPAEAFAGKQEPQLLHDALHLNEASHIILANWLWDHLQVDAD